MNHILIDRRFNRIKMKRLIESRQRDEMAEREKKAHRLGVCTNAAVTTEIEINIKTKLHNLHYNHR